VQKNLLILSAFVAEVEPMRYTPAGLPALNVRLEHTSQQMQSGVIRTVNVALKAVAFGAVAESLAKQAVGSVWRFQGFMANALKGKSVVFHIQEFLQD